MINKIRKLREITNPSIRTYILASLAVFIAFVGVTIWTWNNSKNSVAKEQQITLSSATGSANDLINTTVATYGEVLKGASGLFIVNPNTSEVDWTRYVSNLNFQNRFPGMQGIAYSQVVPKDQLADFLANNKQVNGESYVIKPDYERDPYVINRFIVSSDPDSKNFVGFDLFTDAARRKSMEQARDSGQLAVTGNVPRLSDKQAGFTMFLPIYKRDMPLTTVEERRAALLGYISSGIRIKELLNGLFAKSLTKDSAIRFYEGDKKSPNKLVFESPSYKKLENNPSAVSESKSFEIGGNKWTLAAIITKDFTGFGSQAQKKLPETILWGGIVLSFLISFLLFIIMVSRARSITSEKNQEVQEVKDSLISLASHQLRTPATGVKQFISMVLEGYAGKINSEQRSMLEKAYVSNERQLEIINQILHVTRADSGRLVLNKQKLDIIELVNEVIDEHHQSLSSRQQKLKLKATAKKIYVKADRQYMAMALDNLISNANKYSHIKKNIEIDVRRTAESIIISVLDHGVGIDDSDMHLLFQKFSRIQNELSVEAGGNGIGLYLCREIVELHGGTIEVESEPGVGSTFTITLPRN